MKTIKTVCAYAVSIFYCFLLFVFVPSFIMLLVFVQGCGSGGGDGKGDDFCPSNTTCDDDGDDNEGPTQEMWDRALVYKSTVRMRVPEGTAPGDFLVIYTGEPGGGTWTSYTTCEEYPAPCFVACKNATSCEYTINGDNEDDGGFDNDLARNRATEIQVLFVSPNYLFVPHVFSVTLADNGSTKEINWNTPGSWGLAPNGRYRSTNGGIGEITTRIIDGIIVINLGGGHTAQVTGNIFNNEDMREKTGEENTVEGSISDDLSTVTYKIVSGDRIWEGTETLME